MPIVQCILSTIWAVRDISKNVLLMTYEVATISRLLKIIGLFCRM